MAITVLKNNELLWLWCIVKGLHCIAPDTESHIADAAFKRTMPSGMESHDEIKQWKRVLYNRTPAENPIEKAKGSVMLIQD